MWPKCEPYYTGGWHKFPLLKNGSDKSTRLQKWKNSHPRHTNSPLNLSLLGQHCFTSKWLLIFSIQSTPHKDIIIASITDLPKDLSLDGFNLIYPHTPIPSTVRVNMTPAGGPSRTPTLPSFLINFAYLILKIFLSNVNPAQTIITLP